MYSSSSSFCLFYIAEGSVQSISVLRLSRSLAVVFIIGMSGSRFSRFLKKTYVNQQDRQYLAAFGKRLPL
jgi:hypothetical protein